MNGAEDDEPFRPPLPMEDRLWRHPSEVAASRRAAGESQTSTVTVRTPLPHALTFAGAGAVGGAILVAGLFLTLGGGSGSVIEAPPDPVFQAVALEPIMPLAARVPVESWPNAVADRSADGVAAVEVTTPAGARRGSAVMFRTDGYLLTSYDLVDDADTVTVTLATGREYDGEVLGADSISGLAVLAIPETDAAAAPLALLDSPVVGDHAVTLSGGAPTADLVHTQVSALAVSVPVADDQSLHGLIQTDAGSPPSATGGAVVGASGAVMGIVVDVGGEHATYAVPIGYARKIAGDILEVGAARHTWLGIRGSDVEGPDSGPLEVERAVRVHKVILDSPAYAAGIDKGDLIVAIDGEPTTSMTELILELRRHAPGQIVDVAVVHDGEHRLHTVELSVRLADDTT